MLVIYSNENNPAALKLLVAKNYAGKTVELKLINASDRSIPRLLPYLKLDDDENIFIPNAAIWYLYPPSDGISGQVTEWLEWESRILAPNLAQTGLKNEKSKATVVANLQKLNRSLENKTYLIENSATICDIAIFATLYPLYKDRTLSNDFLAGLTNITAYLKGLENQKPFKDAIAEFKIDPKSAYQAFAAGAKYFSSAPTVTNEEQPQSPQHQASEVTNEELIAAAKSWKKSSKDLAKLKKIGKNVLPVKGEKNVFITSALPYVNNVPHLGNIIGCVLSADVFARYSRLCNNNTLYISGTDEYGTATETKALEEKLTCQAICDKYYKIHNEIYKWFNISFDHFGRTSTPQQTELCQEMFHTLNANGFMFTQSVEQLHCENCDRYLADRFVEGGCPNIGCTYEDARGDQCDGCGKLVNAIELKNPRCKICSQTPKLKSSHQYFIDLPQLEPLLHSWIKTSSPGWSHNAEVISKAWLKEGLKPRCITRDLKWGVPVPLDGYRQKVFYVWFDAPIGYMSISKAYTKDFKKWWKPEKDVVVKLYQFMAKDNVPFHAVLFPAMLLGANEGYVTVSHIMATEYLNYEDGKFSKSRGVGVFGTDARDTGIPSDVWRFYLLFVRPESQDSSFSWTDLATKNNSELLNNFGNFVNRALVFAKNNYNKIVPEMHLSKDDYTLLALCTREYKGYVAALEKAKLRDGIRHILAISKHGNQYMQANQPWVLLKGSDADKIKAGTVIGLCCNLSYLLAILLQPYMPDTSANLLKQLNCAESIITPENVEIISFLPAGHKMGEPSPLFTKINLEVVEELKKKYAGQQQSESSSSSLSVKSLEEAVAKQGEKVRNLKAAGGDKTLWQPEIAILLDLKKQLEVAKKSAEAKPVDVDVKSLEAAVTKQGEKLRALKASGAEKATWQPEVVILLDLKKQLEAAQKSQPAVPNGVPQAKVVVDVKSLEKKVEDQGLVVRKLKEGGAEKSVWQPEVEKLLALKKELNAATGVPATTTKKPKKAKK